MSGTVKFNEVFTPILGRVTIEIENKFDGLSNILHDENNNEWSWSSKAPNIITSIKPNVPIPTTLKLVAKAYIG